MLLFKHKNAKLAWRLPNYYNVSAQRNGLIKFTNYDETKKRAHDWQIIRAKENFKLSHGGPSQRQALGTNQRMNSLLQDHHLKVCRYDQETYNNILQTNPKHSQEESKDKNSGLTLEHNKSKAIGSLFPSKMTAKLERTQRTAKQNKDLTLNHHKP